MNRSLSQLGDQIHVPANTLVVFNPLNWQWAAVVETDLFEQQRRSPRSPRPISATPGNAPGPRRAVSSRERESRSQAALSLHSHVAWMMRACRRFP
jgi:hypothetical protein